jgi:hypothetical protein
MKEIAIHFSPDELRELAKQLYMASFFMLACQYDNEPMVNEIMNKVCATGMAEAPETGDFRHGGPDEPLFYIGYDAAQECDPIIDIYNGYVIKERIPHELADRDFAEQYHTFDPEIVLTNPEMLSALHALQKKYIEEFERYGVTHLRLVEPE